MILKLTLRQLEILMAISVTGSISRATRQLGMAQPSISQQLAKMEETLGIQLLSRGPSSKTDLTPAGIFWADSAARILSAVKDVETRHDELFNDRGVSLSFGTTPSLTGRFTEIVSSVAASLDNVSRFDLIWTVNSTDLIKQVMLHKVDIAVLSAESLLPYRQSLRVYDLYEDKIVWAVPNSLSDDDIRASFSSKVAEKTPACLQRYASLEEQALWASTTRNWYQNIFPQAQPFFNCMTHQHAIRIVAAGLATCHTPMSLIPNLPETVLERVRFYDLGKIARVVSLAMPKHLYNVRAFHDFAERITHIIRHEYGPERFDLHPMPDITMV